MVWEPPTHKVFVSPRYTHTITCGMPVFMHFTYEISSCIKRIIQPTLYGGRSCRSLSVLSQSQRVREVFGCHTHCRKKKAESGSAYAATADTRDSPFSTFISNSFLNCCSWVIYLILMPATAMHEIEYACYQEVLHNDSCKGAAQRAWCLNVNGLPYEIWPLFQPGSKRSQ